MMLDLQLHVLVIGYQGKFGLGFKSLQIGISSGVRILSHLVRKSLGGDFGLNLHF